MTQFDKREKAAEAHFALGQELQFKVEARTAKLAAQWLAEKIGLTGDEATTYVHSVISANLAQSGLDDLRAKLIADSATHNLGLDDATIGAEIERCLQQSMHELQPKA